MPAKYHALAETLRNAVLARSWPTDRLPGELALARQYGVSRETVRAALNLLVEQGLVEKRRGSGSYISAAVPRRRTVAVVVGYGWDYILPKVLAEIRERLLAHGYDAEVLETSNHTGAERTVLHRLLAGRYAGVLMEGVHTALPNPNLDLYEALRRKGTPLVFYHSAPAALPNALCVWDDNEGGGYLLTRYLIGLGHRQIGGIFKSDDAQGPRRYLGYAKALRDADLPLPDTALLWYDTEDRHILMDGGDLGMLQSYLKHRLGNCTAVVCYNDEMAYCLLRTLRQAGRAVPAEVSVAGFDNSFYSDRGPVPLTTLAHSAPGLGGTAVQTLLDLLDGQNGQSVTLPWLLCPKASTAPPAG